MRPNAFYIGHLAGFPLFADFSALFLLVFVFLFHPGIGLVGQVLLLIALVVTIVAHELGHALTARARGMAGIQIVLGPLGGYCTYVGHQRPGTQLLISLAGPAMNALLAVLSYFVLRWMVAADWNANPRAAAAVLVQLVSFTFWVNVVLGAFNVLPIYPLDGGQALLNGARLFKDERLARMLTLNASFIAAFAAIAWYLYFFGHLPIFGMVLVGVLLYQAYQTLR